MIGFLTASLVSVVVAVGSFPDIPLEELKLRSSRLTCSVYYYYIIIINIQRRDGNLLRRRRPIIIINVKLADE